MYLFKSNLSFCYFTTSSCCILRWRISSVWQQVCCVNWLRTRKLQRQSKLKEPLLPSLSSCIPAMRALVSIYMYKWTMHTVLIVSLIGIHAAFTSLNRVFCHCTSIYKWNHKDLVPYNSVLRVTLLWGSQGSVQDRDQYTLESHITHI